jgi:hypothetical protein
MGPEAWYIDPRDGDDTNNGTALAPLRTFAELKRRLGEKARVFHGDLMITYVRHDVTVYDVILSDELV